MKDRWESWEYINRSYTHECRNWDWGRAIPFLGINKSKFLCCVSDSPRNNECLCDFRECEEVLGPKGFCGVQVSPPMEHIQGGQWWVRWELLHLKSLWVRASWARWGLTVLNYIFFIFVLSQARNMGRNIEKRELKNGRNYRNWKGRAHEMDFSAAVCWKSSWIR